MANSMYANFVFFILTELSKIGCTALQLRTISNTTHTFLYKLMLNSYSMAFLWFFSAKFAANCMNMLHINYSHKQIGLNKKGCQE